MGKVIGKAMTGQRIVDAIVADSAALADLDSAIGLAAEADAAVTAAVTAADIPGEVASAITAADIPGDVASAITAADIPGDVAAAITAADIPGTVAAAIPYGSVTASQLADKTHSINTTGKTRGKLCYEATNDKLYFAIGITDVSKWRPTDDFTGAGDITPA